MKSNGQRKENKSDAPKKHNGSQASTQVRKPTKRCRGPSQKVTGILSLNATQEISKQHSARSTSLRDTKQEILALTVKTGQVKSSTKIKLQLFPIDEDTRIGLEKDGYNPFLELTLSARKKLLSVLAHIGTKWGSSSIALGEPMLLPDSEISEIPATGRRWTLKDTSITAGDVYASVGSPPIFRLRYGWYSNQATQQVPSTSTPFACIKSESMHKGCNTISDLTREEVEVKGGNNLNVINETADAVVTNRIPLVAADDEVKMDIAHEQSMAPWSDIFTDLSIGGLLSEASLQGKINNNGLKSNASRSSWQPIPLISDISIGGLLTEASLLEKISNHGSLSGNKVGPGQSPFEWDDGLTALSIGGLLSEASLQGKISNSDKKSNESKSAVKPLKLMSNSFDAVIPSQMNSCPQAGKPSSYECHSSILDAEETCHAFSYQKFSSFDKNVRLGEKPSYDISSNSFKFPNFSELKKQTMLTEDPHSQELKTKASPHSQIRGEESNSSLGLRGIKWNDSRGPFDLGLSTMPHFTGGDSVHEIVR